MVDSEFAVAVLKRIEEIIEPIQDPEQIKGVVAVIREALEEKEDK